MEEMGSLWGYNEEGIDEVKQKLMYTSLELESVRLVADEEMKKNKENVTSLLNLLKVAYQERDEAREQLRTVLHKLKPPHPIGHNSSITESNSQNSSPVSSFTSADLSNANNSNKGILVNEAEDPLEGLVRGKVLPEKGRLLQAVMDSGPLLSTLMVGGPLPQWRNPPPLQAFKIIPPVSINAPHQPHSTLKHFNYFDHVSCGSSSSQLSTPMLNFRTGPCLNNGRLMLTSGAGTSNQIPLPKRQRFF